MKASADRPKEAELAQVLEWLNSDFLKDNPLNFVLWAFPWGEKGTRLATQKGPRAWQTRELLAIAEHIKENKARVARGEDPTTYRLAVSSGRGIGKSTLVSWLTLWMVSCHFGSTTIISANTDNQISNITFGEIEKWLVMSQIKWLFDVTQKKISPQPWYVAALDKFGYGCKYYYIEGKLWDQDSPHNFAGAHSDTGMMVIFDEASGIPAVIWDVAEGYFTDKTIYRFFVAFSNPRSGSGGFYECFFHPKSKWQTRKINALEIAEIDHAIHKESYIDRYGIDSDQARVEVFGEFPRTGDNQFISRTIVEEAAHRILPDYNSKEEPLVMGVDVARFGADTSVFVFRAGRDARSIPAQIYSGLDNMQLVAKIEQAIYTHNPDALFVDGGAGAGVIDRLKELGYKPIEVLFGSAATEPQYFDHRTELYGRLRDWLPGGMIPDDLELKSGLCAPEKLLIGRESKEKLESKEQMKKRGQKSPDFADALALTFHSKVAKRTLTTARKSKKRTYKERKSIFD